MIHWLLYHYFRRLLIKKIKQGKPVFGYLIIMFVELTMPGIREKHGCQKALQALDEYLSGQYDEEKYFPKEPVKTVHLEETIYL